MLLAEARNIAEEWDPRAMPEPVRPRTRPRRGRRRVSVKHLLTRRVEGREFLRYALVFIICALMALVVTVRYASLAEAGYRLNAAEQRLAELEREHQDLVAIRDGLMNPARIEAVATETLGMKNSESYRPVTVAVQRRGTEAPVALVASTTVALGPRDADAAGPAGPGDPVLEQLSREVYAWFVGPRAAQAHPLK